MRKKPSQASSTGMECMSPSVTRVLGEATTIPALLRPMMAKKSPIPAEVPARKVCGMPVMSSERSPSAEMSRKRQPDRNTAPSAACQL